MGTGTRQIRSPQKSSSSKYDFVKVRVHLNDHYYVLSRFLLSRMLTASRIDYGHALRIALDLKKRLVDKGELDVSQEALQHELFRLLKEHGYDSEHVQWYRTLESFHHQRIPLVVLIAGTGCTGKSTIATGLSERLNLSSVLNTEVIYDLTHTIIDGKLPPRLWTTGGDFKATVVKESHLVCKGLNADLCKTIEEGKSIIIEGSLVSHLLLDHVHQSVRQLNKDVVVAPFVLIIDERDQQRMTTTDDSPESAERIAQYQTYLIAENQARIDRGQPSFHAMHIDIEAIQSTIDAMQAMILDQIANQVAKKAMS
ncbi:hypothetical protein BX666DRAFT_2026807 [Dichotomocladium elegans]|nr:hypothetical protein BX666DRAFT_2026807 [Dichotomocladium elegans]